MSLHARLQAVRDDHALLVRSVTIRAAYAFGDWPPLSTEPPTAWSATPLRAGVRLGGSVERGDALWGRPIG